MFCKRKAVAASGISQDLYFDCISSKRIVRLPSLYICQTEFILFLEERKENTNSSHLKCYYSLCDAKCFG